jgi:glutathionylspermidine synthase
MIMSYEGYQEALESQKEKEDELSSIKQQFNNMQSMLEKLVEGLSNTKDQQQINSVATSLFSSGLLKLSPAKNTHSVY